VPFKQKGDGLRVQDCDECGRLWDAYGHATFKRVRAENTLNLATASYEEADAMQSLERELERASQAADECYKTLTRHAAIAHGGQSLGKSANHSLG